MSPEADGSLWATHGSNLSQKRLARDVTQPQPAPRGVFTLVSGESREAIETVLLLA
jgi:hypothetical protein